MSKEPKGVFQEKVKEPVIERVFMMIDRYPSRSAAARAWGINVNTLKNYYRRQDIQPTPRPSLLKKIAEHEGVSLEWLTTGEGERPQSDTKEPLETPKSHIDSSDGLYALLSLLTEQERMSLYQAFVRKGVDAMLQLVLEFATLSPSELERAIRLVRQIKEGATESNQQGELSHPTQKQAG